MAAIEKKNKLWTLIFGITVILSMTAFFLMYRMNNEYTARGEQPIQGILCLDEEKAAGKLHYLAREWQYFPGKLLTDPFVNSFAKTISSPFNKYNHR